VILNERILNVFLSVYFV